MFLFGSKSKKNTILTDQVSNTGIVIQNEERLRQLELVNLTEYDLQLIKRLKPYVEENVVEVVQQFYEAVENVPTLKEVIQLHSTSERLRHTLRTHIIEMFEGRIDEAFIEKRRRLGMMHVKINLYPKWYLAAFQNLEKSLRKVVIDLQLSIEEEQALCNAIDKMCNFEQQIVLEEYDHYSRELIEQERESVKFHVREVIGGISTQLKGQSHTTIDAVTELMSSAKQVKNHISASIEEAKIMQKISSEGTTKMMLLNEQTGKINSKTIEMAEMVQVLDSSSSQINAVVVMVKSIAEQTNMLALNSAIEAARAGEHGKGFAVVADEVRRLANQTKDSVEQIASLIGKSNGITSQVVNAIQEIQELVNSGIAQNRDSLRTFDEISGSVDISIINFENVGNKITELASIVENIGQSSTELELAATQLDLTIKSF